MNVSSRHKIMCSLHVHCEDIKMHSRKNIMDMP